MNDDTQDTSVDTTDNFDVSSAKQDKSLELYGPFATGQYDEVLINLVQTHRCLYDVSVDVEERTKVNKRCGLG